MRGCARRRALALAAAWSVWCAGTAPVSAHALLLASVPRPDEALPSAPVRVILRFNGRVEGPLSRASISGGPGQRVPLRIVAEGTPDQLVAVVPPLAPGAYTLEWEVLSVDGHVTRGGFRFLVWPDS